MKNVNKFKDFYKINQSMNREGIFNKLVPTTLIKF